MPQPPTLPPDTFDFEARLKCAMHKIFVFMGLQQGEPSMISIQSINETLFEAVNRLFVELTCKQSPHQLKL